MIADLHLHTRYSADSEEEPVRIVESAIEKGIGIICFTDHMDYDFGEAGETYTFDPDRYCTELERLAGEYRTDIKILIGVEFGMQPHLRNRFEALKDGWPFDYILGSQHLVYGSDPYYPDVFRGRSDLDLIERWFEELEESLLVYPEINSLAHIDYIFRYVRGGEKYSYEQFREPIDRILRFLIFNDISLEVNSGGFSKIRCMERFHENLLRQYADQGGRKVTTGSDAHICANVGVDFKNAFRLIAECGELDYTFFEKQSPKSLYLQQFFD